MSEYREIRVQREGRTTSIVLDRPPLNVMTVGMMEEIRSALEDVEKDGAVHLVILRGAGRCFSAGVEIRDHLPDRAPDMLRSVHRLVEAFIATRTPVMAAVHGMALGGALEFATLADFVLVEEGTRLGLPEIRLASYPPVAAAFYPSMIGWKNTMELLLTGGEITPERARDLGLVTAVLPRDGFDAEVSKWADRILGLSLPALKLCKMAALSGFIQRPFDALDTAMTLFATELMKKRDAVEGLQAFLEKRQPRWEHR